MRGNGSIIQRLQFQLLFLLSLIACGNPSNDRSVSLDDLDSIQAEDQTEWEKYTPKRSALTAIELIHLSDCDNLPCVQLFMKDLSRDFFYAKKGEYAAQHLGVVVDTAGTQLTMPMSTFYVDVNPQASWRAAHTVHTRALGDSLYNEFKSLGFTLADEGRYLGIKSIQQRYVSEAYPNKSLYVTATFNPWGFKGLYENNVSWPCYVFEVYSDK